MTAKIDTIEQLLYLLANRGGIPQPGMRYNWPAFRLARYDVGFVQNITNHLLIKGETTLTDAQYHLCVKLAKKYRRQLLKSEYDFSSFNWDEPATNCTIIELDRTRKVYIEAQRIKLRFRFDSRLVSAMNELHKCAQGEFYWDREQKLWIVFPSLANVKLVVPWAIQQGFEVDEQLREVYASINETEQPLFYELIRKEGMLAIPDAVDSLRTAVASLIERQNLFDLCWNSTRYGYGISTAVQQEFDDCYRDQLTHFEFARSLVFGKVIPATSVEAVNTTLCELKSLATDHRYAVCINKFSTPVITKEDFEDCADEIFSINTVLRQEDTRKIDNYFDLSLFDTIMYKTGLRRSLISQSSNKIILFNNQ